MNRFNLSAVAISLTMLTACMPETEHRPLNPLVVDTFTVAEATDTQFRTFNGQVMPAELTPLAFRLDGEITSMLVKEGDVVTKGQIIAVLDDTKARQKLVDAQARYELALKQVKRGQELRSNKMISDSELDELSANFELAKANLGAAQASMEYMRLKAPFDAVVSSVDKKKHENVSPGEQVVSVYQSGEVYVKIEVSDSVLAMLDPQAQAQNYQPTATFAGHDLSYKVTYLEHTSELHPNSQTYELWLKMPQVEQSVLPGTSAKVSVDLAKAGLTSYQAYQVPMTSIDSGKQSQDFYIWKLQDGAAHRVAINIDQITGNGALVSNGIEQGDVLINSNLRKLREGMLIKGAEL
ncbi:efflux RND transporter periplasmic adaptor subunit [Vibrio brasiliensis]|uniref:efflux RND transporter periplasmic adaptor subunit n=1 Tax=Vibrio brasiliensis TaxID=170652 RepID=UPI001EFCE6B8|nr:efflux RND transporter periplasmic adaptor subunit [Vibrio brasiliensis]MCG9648166.1 efflux RND transporter periplasmic adaptor subunit [Vibrio brasiliensis]